MCKSIVCSLLDAIANYFDIIFFDIVIDTHCNGYASNVVRYCRPMLANICSIPSGEPKPIETSDIVLVILHIVLSS